MSNLSELIGGGGGGKTVDFVASGTLPSGRNVILNANGTVSLSATVTATQAIPNGSPQTTPDSTYSSRYAFLPATPNKFILLWSNSSGVGKYNIGTLSGTTLSFGPEFNTGIAMGFLQVEADPIQPNRILILGQQSSQYGTFASALYDPASETVTFSTMVVIASKINFAGTFGFDPATTTTSKFAVSYRYRDYLPNNWACASRAGYMALSNTAVTPTLGTQYIFVPSINGYAVTTVSMAFRPDSAGNFLLLYKEVGYSPPAGYYYRGCTVSAGTGTAITFGTATRWQSSAGSNTQVKFDPNGTAGKAIVLYARSLNTNAAILARVFTLSGTSVSYGAEATVVNPPYDRNSSMNNTALSFQANTGGIFSIVYHSYFDASTTALIRCRLGTYSGTSITLQTEISLSINAPSPTQAGDPNNAGFFIVDSNLQPGASVCQMAVPVANTNTNNYLGITDAAIANGETGKVVLIGGVSATVSSLTPNSDYYVQQDGTLGTSSVYPAVKAGRALSATSINLEYS